MRKFQVLIRFYRNVESLYTITIVLQEYERVYFNFGQSYGLSRYEDDWSHEQYQESSLQVHEYLPTEITKHANFHTAISDLLFNHEKIPDNNIS